MGRVIAAAYSAGRRVADIAVEESGAWAAKPGHFVWIGIDAPSERDLRQLQAQFGRICCKVSSDRKSWRV
jgi:magnesium transporter